jgi:hypothetical protein
MSELVAESVHVPTPSERGALLVDFARGGGVVRAAPCPPPTHRAAPFRNSPLPRSLRAFLAVLGREVGGFDFGLKHRNTALVAAAGARVPRAKKTGTTICGLVYKVRLAAALRRRRRRRRTALTHPCRLCAPLRRTALCWAPTRARQRTRRCGIFAPPRRRAHPRAALHRSHAPARLCADLGQELRKDPLHCAEHLLLRRGHGGGHGGDYEAHLQPAGAAAAGHARGLARRLGDDHAQAPPVPAPGPDLGRARPRRRRRHGPAPVHHLPARLHRQAALRDHGLGLGAWRRRRRRQLAAR